MANKFYEHNTFVFFIDNDDSYIRDVLARFEEINNYNIKIYTRSKDFFKEFKRIDHSKKRIFIIFVSTSLELDEKNNVVSALMVLKKIKKLNPYSEVILYSEDDDINLISEAFNHGAYTFIKKNENIILRIENNIKGIISQKKFLLKKQSSKFFTRLFLLFIAAIALLGLVLYLIFPEWFVL